MPDTGSETAEDLYAEGYAQAIRDAALVVRHYAKGRPTQAHIRMMAAEVRALTVPDPSTRDDLREAATA